MLYTHKWLDPPQLDPPAFCVTFLMCARLNAHPPSCLPGLCVLAPAFQLELKYNVADVIWVKHAFEGEEEIWHKAQVLSVTGNFSGTCGWTAWAKRLKACKYKVRFVDPNGCEFMRGSRGRGCCDIDGIKYHQMRPRAGQSAVVVK